jgi:hypothetical protein
MAGNKEDENLDELALELRTDEDPKPERKMIILYLKRNRYHTKT